MAAIARAGPARPLRVHRVAVDAGHDRGGLAGNSHQDRRGRAAVHRPVVDPSQHDDGGGGIQPVAGRQEQADPGQGTHAGKHPDQGADDAAAEGVDHDLRESAMAKPWARFWKVSNIRTPRSERERHQEERGEDVEGAEGEGQGHGDHGHEPSALDDREEEADQEDHGQAVAQPLPGRVP